MCHATWSCETFVVLIWFNDEYLSSVKPPPAVIQSLPAGAFRSPAEKAGDGVIVTELREPDPNAAVVTIPTTPSKSRGSSNFDRKLTLILPGE
jgi:hypothetical protein